MLCEILVYSKVVCAQLLSHVWDPMDCGLPGSSVHEIFQARILEWVAISSCRGSSWVRDLTHASCIGRQIIKSQGNSLTLGQPSGWSPSG